MWGEGVVAALLHSPGAKQAILPSSASLVSAAFYKSAENKHPSELKAITCFPAVSAGVSGTIGQRDSVGRESWDPPVDWKHQMVVLVLYRLIFKRLKIILTGRKLVPGFSFAATTELAGEGRSTLQLSVGKYSLGATVISRETPNPQKEE